MLPIVINSFINKSQDGALFAFGKAIKNFIFQQKVNQIEFNICYIRLVDLTVVLKTNYFEPSMCKSLCKKR